MYLLWLASGTSALRPLVICAAIKSSGHVGSNGMVVKRYVHAYKFTRVLISICPFGSFGTTTISTDMEREGEDESDTPMYACVFVSAATDTHLCKPCCEVLDSESTSFVHPCNSQVIKAFRRNLSESTRSEIRVPV